MVTNYRFCEQLRTIPESKSKLYREDVLSKCPVCKGADRALCDKCSLQLKVFDRYVNANIPVDFWDKDMFNFKGDQKLLRIFNNINESFREYYRSGKSICLVGSHGVGKTFFACSILKAAVIRGYGGLYTTLGDVVNVLIHGDSWVKFAARTELVMCSFLVLDEFDSRFLGNSNSAELFGRILESVLRIRLQNLMPTILISNDPDPTKALGADLGASVSSLISGYMKKISVIGADYREVLKENKV
jgi:DNA replication protein DnaC